MGAINVGGYMTELKTAHNGYLETYLDGGAVGIVLLITMLLFIGARHARAFIRGSPFGELGFAFFCMTLLMNVSESIFARRSPLWNAFLMLGIGWWLFLPAVESRNVYVPAPSTGKAA